MFAADADRHTERSAGSTLRGGKVRMELCTAWCHTQDRRETKYIRSERVSVIKGIQIAVRILHVEMKCGRKIRVKRVNE